MAKLLAVGSHELDLIDTEKGPNATKTLELLVNPELNSFGSATLIDGALTLVSCDDGILNGRVYRNGRSRPKDIDLLQGGTDQAMRHGSVYWFGGKAEVNKVEYVIGQGSIPIGKRTADNLHGRHHLDSPKGFFSQNNSLFDYGPYGIFLTHSDKQLSEMETLDVATADGLVYILENGRIRVTDWPSEPGKVLRPAVQPAQIAPVGGQIYFTTEFETLKRHSGLFRLDQKTGDAYLRDQRGKWQAWPSDKARRILNEVSIEILSDTISLIPLSRGLVRSLSSYAKIS
jgi:hypothetical protein